MNIQAMMKQAQKIQQDMAKAKSEIDAQTFTGASALVEAEVNGQKELLKIKINKEAELSKEDLEMLEDMILLAINEAMKKVDQEIEQKLGKFGEGLQGLM
jgi:DNA-binding YbaB/EbfC family protein